MVRRVQKYQFKALKTHETAMVLKFLSMNQIMVVHLDPKMGLKAFPTL